MIVLPQLRKHPKYFGREMAEEDAENGTYATDVWYGRTSKGHVPPDMLGDALEIDIYAKNNELHWLFAPSQTQIPFSLYEKYWKEAMAPLIERLESLIKTASENALQCAGIERKKSNTAKKAYDCMLAIASSSHLGAKVDPDGLGSIPSNDQVLLRLINLRLANGERLSRRQWDPDDVLKAFSPNAEVKKGYKVGERFQESFQVLRYMVAKEGIIEGEDEEIDSIDRADVHREIDGEFVVL